MSLLVVERQKTLVAERQKREAERKAESTRQQTSAKMKAWKEMVHQLQISNERRKKQMKDHYDELLIAKIKEQRLLLKEGFKKEADQLRREVENLKARRR